MDWYLSIMYTVFLLLKICYGARRVHVAKYNESTKWWSDYTSHHIKIVKVQQVSFDWY